MPKKKLVVLTGAGISSESGLKTFRDSDGLWEGYKVEEVATPQAWKENPELVLSFYNMRRRDVLAAKPNAAHLGLAELEEYFDVQIITQNVDDLHERAGSSNVLHLHGHILKMRSEKNESLVYDISVDMHLGDFAEDGGQLRPHIVWFNEPVPLIEEAKYITQNSDYFVVVGTSLVVYPAAGLLHFVPQAIPIYVVDKNIPYLSSINSITAIEKPATEGVRQLINLLLKN